MSETEKGSPRPIEDMPPHERGKATDLPPETDRAGDGYFDAIVYPNRSLGAAGFLVVMGVIVGVNITLGFVFLSIGAWPVLGFCGLDILLVWTAFRLSYRQGRMYERVRLTEEALLVTRVLATGHETRWRLLPMWTRVEIYQRGEHEVCIRVISRGRTLILGSFLSPAERETFGDALRSALTGGQVRSNIGQTR